MILAALETLLILELVWAVALVLLLGATIAFRSSRDKRRAAEAATRSTIQDALAACLCGDPDLVHLRALAAAHPGEMQDSLLAFQTVVGGRCEGVCELALSLGFVRQWCDSARSGSATARRRAFSNIAVMAHYAPVRGLIGDLAERGLTDSDEEIGAAAARILVQSEDPGQVTRLFESAPSLAPRIRLLIARDLRRHAIQLCRTAVPRVLSTADKRGLIVALKMLASWECGLPLDDVGEIVEHPDPEVRLEVMRLLAFLPTTPENHGAILRGLADEDPRVSVAAIAAVGRLKLVSAIPLVTSCLRRGIESLARSAADALAEMPLEGWTALEGQLRNPDRIASGAARDALQMVHAGGGD